ncbi:hypothetical protein CEXT_3251 [Caerostris extrusa]|uniref:Uncharacterized protein n=1 Tax=Caerostris extrusa TaxID=172846 RepID=A0AAV4SB20_CAEEX|nr:hypothetical protein CEXT_3251 [Caerostris extrusa]
MHEGPSVTSRGLIPMKARESEDFFLGTENKSDEDVETEFFPYKGMQILTELNPTQTEEGWPIIEGDIVLPPGTRKKTVTIKRPRESSTY